VARALPALIRAEKLQKRAARVGFDWPDVKGAIEKLEEELAEVRAEIKADDDAALQEELGDLLFSVVNVTRLLGMDAEQTLSRANEKFERRFRSMEQRLHSNGRQDLLDLSPEAWDEVWEVVKRREAEPEQGDSD
jgi:uncharacterized protein YabN with tetrapyrrole methylase and pyrophosphatase domain